MATYQRAYKAMGSAFSIRLDLWPEQGTATGGLTPDESNSLLLHLESATEELEQSLSRFRENSELMKLVNRRSEWTKPSQLMIETLELAEQAMILTEYAFDPRVLPHLERIGYTGAQVDLDPNRTSVQQLTAALKLFHSNQNEEIQLTSPIDLGGIGKGCTADRLADIIEAAVNPFDLAGYIIDAGGDLVVSGCQESGEAWGIGIENPVNPSSLAAVASPTGNYGQRMALCTSSLWRNAWNHNGEEVHHLIDPATGHPVKTNLYSVTAAANTAAMAEVITKYVLLRGFEDAPLWQHYSPQCLWIRKSGEVGMTVDMEPYITWLASD